MSGEGDSEGRGKLTDAVLAAELALGLLDGPTLTRAQARAAEDDAFATTAAAWAGRLTPLAQTVAPLPPPPELWRRIEAQLTPAAAAAQPDTTTGPSPAPPSAPSAAGRDRRVWRPIAFVSLALAAACLAALGSVLSRPAPEAPLLAARLMPAAGGAPLLTPEPVFTAVVDPSRGELVLARAHALPGPPLEVWLTAPGGRHERLSSPLPETGVSSFHAEAVRRARAGDRISLAPAATVAAVAEGELTTVR